MHFSLPSINCSAVPTYDYCQALFRCLNCAQRSIWLPRSAVVASWEEPPYIWLTVAKKRICRFELWILESACCWKAQYHKIIQIISRKPKIMLAVLFGIKCKKKILAKPNNAKKSASTICKSLLINRKDDKNYKKMYCCSLLHYRLKSIFIRSYVIRIVIKHWDCIVSYSSCASSFPRKLFHCEWHTNWDFSHDVTKIWTRKLLILLLFYFHDV